MTELVFNKITPTPSSKKVAMFKLLGGNELLCKVLSPTTDGWEVEDVREIAPQQNRQGGWSLALAPYFIAVMDYKKPVTIFRHAVVGVLYDLPDELEREYISATSGIAIAKAGSI